MVSATSIKLRMCSFLIRSCSTWILIMPMIRRITPNFRICSFLRAQDSQPCRTVFVKGGELSKSDSLVFLICIYCTFRKTCDGCSLLSLQILSSKASLETSGHYLRSILQFHPWWRPAGKTTTKLLTALASMPLKWRVKI
jgi:hypothetical protein